jgi:hypothetical protein
MPAAQSRKDTNARQAGPNMHARLVDSQLAEAPALKPSCTQKRVLFLLSPSRAYGEINVAVPLAKGLADLGAEVWFVASALAARIASKHFAGRVFTMGPNREANQVTFWRTVKKFRPNLIVFSELYEILQPRRMPECPLVDGEFLQDINNLDAALVFLDFITHVPALREIASCAECASPFGQTNLTSFLQRLQVVLPCPLNEPGEVSERRGVPYRVQGLPVSIQPEERTRVRARFLGAKSARKDILIVRTGSTWQAKLAKEFGVRVYNHFTDLLAAYLRGIKRPVTIVSVSDKQRLSPDRSGKMRVVNVSNLDPLDYQGLILSADLVLTDNQIGYTLATTIGSVAGAVLVNSFEVQEILRQEGYGTALARIVRRIERECPGSIYPHRIFPLPMDADAVSGEPGTQPASASFGPDVVRLGRMRSSPYVKIEMYGGRRTADLFRWLLEDPSAKDKLRQQDKAYIERLNAIDDGPTVLSRMLEIHQAEAHTAW